MKIVRNREQILLLFFVLGILVQGCQTHSRLGDSRSEIRSGMELLDKGHEEEALNAFEALVSRDDSDFDTIILVASVLSLRDMHEESLPFLQRAIKNQPSDESNAERQMRTRRNSIAYTMIGDAHYHIGNMEQAEVAYAEAVRLDADNATAANNWGYMYAEKGIKLDKALELTRRAVDLEPGNGYFVDSLGWVYFHMGETRQAVEYLRQAVELLPSDAELRYHLGRAYEAEDNAQAAMVEYRKALILSPSHEAAEKRLGDAPR